MFLKRKIKLRTKFTIFIIWPRWRNRRGIFFTTQQAFPKSAQFDDFNLWKYLTGVVT